MFRQIIKLPLRSCQYASRCKYKGHYVTTQYYQVIRQASTDSPPKKKSRKGLYYTLGLIVLGTGAVVVYAKRDPDFRAWLDQNVPGSDRFINVVFQEDDNYLDSIYKMINQISDTIFLQVYKLFSKEEVVVQKTDDSQEEPAKYRLAPRKVEVEVESGKLPDTHPENMVELEKTIGLAAQDAIRAYNDAIGAVKGSTDEIFKLVEKSVERADAKIWSQIRAKVEEKQKLLAAAENKAKDAENQIEKMRSRLQDSTANIPSDVRGRAEKNLEKVLSDVAKAKKKLEDERASAATTDKYWSKVEAARQHFADELEILFPNIKLSDKNLKISQGEIDLFILYACQTILYYQKELNKLETLGQLKLKRAIEQAKLMDPEALETAVEQEVAKERRNLEAELKRHTLELESECNEKVRKQIKLQVEAHSDHLNEAMSMKEKEIERKMKRRLDERVEEEKNRYKTEMGAMISRMQGLNDAMIQRAQQDKKAQQSQILWSACQSLVSALKTATHNKPWTEQLRPLQGEVDAIKKAAAKGDDLVDTIVATIPEKALIRGVYPEDALRERFLKVERVATRVAQVPDGGASAPLLLLAYLQSFFIIKAADPIPSHEIANEPIDPTAFSNYDVLQRARYWMDRGNFEQALRYMNLLKGGARAVARDWMQEVTILLETQQAANALLAHASASGLVYS